MQLFQQSPAALLPLQGPVLWLAHATNALGMHLGHSSHLLQHRAPSPCSNAGDMVSVGSDAKDSRVNRLGLERRAVGVVSVPGGLI